jgi:phosphopantothenate synthetase
MSRKTVFAFWFNTQFVPFNYLSLTKEDLDKVNKKKKVCDFEVKLYFEGSDREKALEEVLKNDRTDAVIARDALADIMVEEFGPEEIDQSKSSESENDT